MNNSSSDLTAYMSSAIERLFNSSIKAAISNPREAAFFMRFSVCSRNAAKKRQALEDKGTHVPAFLIASITSQCNLYCKGCYARANHVCGDKLKNQQLPAKRWGEIFCEAQELGIEFILLAGGEPLMRRDVIEQAASVKSVLFPLFTNGTVLNKSYIELFDKNRHILPVLSMEGNEEQTDERRGVGTYLVLADAMSELRKKGIFYGASITVTTKNMETVTGNDFVQDIFDKGCRFVVFVEYVPVAAGSDVLALADKEREYLQNRQQKLRRTFTEMIFLSFPGDEKALGGCLAGGRGFFHINPSGGAEPCPFSPYSDTSLADMSFLNALNSPLFLHLRESGLLESEHTGGCTLFAQDEIIRQWTISNQENQKGEFHGA